MEPNDIQLGLAAAVEEVLETMCFTSVLASGEGVLPDRVDGAAPPDLDWAAPMDLGGAVPAAGDWVVPASGQRAAPAAGDDAGRPAGEVIAPADGDGGAPACTAELRFQGNPSGGFRVSVPWKLARVVGAGFLGLEEVEVSDSQAEEVVCELANMICGSLLSRLESKSPFRITHP